MRYVIIGASAAGCKAAETLRRYAPNSPITVISEEAQPLYSRPLLTYVLSGEVAPDRVWLKGKDYFRQWNSSPSWKSRSCGCSLWAYRPTLKA